MKEFYNYEVIIFRRVFDNEISHTIMFIKVIYFHNHFILFRIFFFWRRNNFEIFFYFLFSNSRILIIYWWLDISVSINFIRV